MRLFAAIAPPDEARDRLEALQAGLPDGRRVSRENLHLTLRFFGELDRPAAEDLDSELKAVKAAPFDLWLDGVGAFGGAKPRALYAAVRPEERLAHLQAKVEQAGRLAGAPLDAQRYTPHITLLRMRPARPDARKLRWLEANAAFLFGPIRVERFALFRSSLAASGPVYEEVADYRLVDR